MLKQLLSRIKLAHLQALHRQRGQSLIIFTFALLGLIGMLGLALDLGLVYVEQVKVGRTVDAATLAGVVELPYEEDAMRRTIEFIELNGYKPGVDTEILVRGCVDTLTTNVGNGNVSELGAGSAITTTNIVTGALVTQYITVEKPKATFMIDTLSYQPADGGCDLASDVYGNANKLRVVGKVNVHMNFMQFFGFRDVPVEDVAVAENITNLDVVVVFDVSGSMEFETTCFDCWVRTDPNDPDYPNNGYFNPLPFNTGWVDYVNTPLAQQNFSIPGSALCTAAVEALQDLAHPEDFYLVHEAELYSREVGDWDLGARSQGQGFWVLQRGARNNDNPLNPEENGAAEGNQAGVEINQSSNVCNPGIAGGTGINCSPVTLAKGAADNVCSSADGGISVDCSAYIKAHPYPVYGQSAANLYPKLQGAAYDIYCFSLDNCWNDIGINDDTRPTKARIPYVEYDFTPTWGGTTYIWIRARGGGNLSLGWNGVAPESLQGYDGSVMWEVDGNGTVFLNQSAANAGTGTVDNRIIPGNWQWINLGTVNVSGGISHTLRIYQGSAGYKIDKIVFTNDVDNDAPGYLAQNNGKGPPATKGSATREACNLCNPEFGLTVGPEDCTCKRSAGDNDLDGYGGGEGCTVVNSSTNQLEDDLYRGIEPLRSAQEAVKNFAKRLDPQFDQIGLVAFSEDVYNTGTDPNYRRRSKLQCLRYAAENGGDCFSGTNPISFTEVFKAVERQWSDRGTNITAGLQEGLEELGIGEGVNSDCNPGLDNKSACDRRGAARKVLILMTDGAPNKSPDDCRSKTDWSDLWNGDVGEDSRHFECAMYYAKQAADNGVIVYTIGIGSGAEPDLLRGIAEGYDAHTASGKGPELHFDARGGTFFNAAKPTDLDAIFTEILGNIYVRIVG